MITALITVHPPFARSRWVGLGAMLVALAVGVVSLLFGFEALANGGVRQGIPAFPFFMFGVVALLGGVSDVRILRSGPLRGAPRLARHLWRMCFALFIAAMSFFLGQADELPEALRNCRRRRHAEPALSRNPAPDRLRRSRRWACRPRGADCGLRPASRRRSILLRAARPRSTVSSARCEAGADAMAAKARVSPSG